MSTAPSGPAGQPAAEAGSDARVAVLTDESPLPLPQASRALLASARTALGLIARGRVRQPTANLGRPVAFADGSAAVVYRETVIVRPPPAEPTLLVVTFRLRAVRTEQGHAAFRSESELNTVLFAGFPGLVSKLWLTHDQGGRYRGFYQWDAPGPAEAYVRALWWVLALVSDPASIHYAVVAGCDRDGALRDPAGLEMAGPPAGEWWRPLPGGRGGQRLRG